MDYKSVIKSRETRKKLLGLLNFVPDKTMVSIQYKIKLGRRLNLHNPKRYTEKLQWYKLFYRNSDMSQCVEKYSVRAYVEKKGCAELLNDCFGVYDSPEEIDFSKLPSRFVLKDTLGGGSNEVVVVKNKDDIDIHALKEQLNGWVSTAAYKKHPGREWPYDNQKHRIIAEKYLEEPNGDLADYKFFCFNGKTQFFYVRTGYSSDHNSGKMAFFNREIGFLEGVGLDYCAPAETKPEIAENIEDMIAYADKLSTGFPHVRVDFYNVQGKIIFGELTFFNASGYMQFTPDQFDFDMGAYFELPDRRR